MASGSGASTGTVMGTGALITIKGENAGTKPYKVELYRDDGLAFLIWTETMGDGTGFLNDNTAGGNVQTQSQIASGGVSQVAGGFSIGTNTKINASAKLIHFVAHY